MTTPATIARQNAFHLEVKKDGMQQRQSGDWVLRLVVHGDDLDKITRAAMGTRYMMALCEIDDNEEPKEESSKQPPDTIPSGDGSRREGGRSWSELKPSQQAGILCDSDPSFRIFLNEGIEIEGRIFNGPAYTDEQVANAVRWLCGVTSRKDILPGTPAARRLREIVSRFRAWEREPEVVG